MDFSRSLQEILDSDELRTDTAVTKDLKNSADKLLCLSEDQKPHFHKLCSDLNFSFKRIIDSASRRKSLTTKLDKLYTMFHEFSIRNGFEMCSTCEKAIGLNIHEILWQRLMEKEFLQLISTKLSPTESGTEESSQVNRTLSLIESNAVRYTAGFIVRKVEQKFSEIKTMEATEFTAALKEMAGKLKIKEPVDQQHPSCKWINLVDRGGLYHVQDIIYDIFITIKHFVDNKLSKILKNRGESIECLQKHNLSWVLEEEEVQSVWSQVTLTLIEDESRRQKLLTEIVHMWITTRGHSKTHRLKEEYKVKKKEGIKGKRSLRKELATD